MAKRNMPTKKIQPAIDKIVEEQKSEELPDDFKEAEKFVVANCERLNVREKPTKDSKVLFVLPAGIPVLVNGMNDDWFHIEVISDSKQAGFVMAQYVREA